MCKLWKKFENGHHYFTPSCNDNVHQCCLRDTMYKGQPKCSKCLRNFEKKEVYESEEETWFWLLTKYLTNILLTFQINLLLFISSFPFISYFCSLFDYLNLIKHKIGTYGWFDPIICADSQMHYYWSALLLKLCFLLYILWACIALQSILLMLILCKNVHSFATISI